MSRSSLISQIKMVLLHLTMVRFGVSYISIPSLEVWEPRGEENAEGQNLKE